MFASHALAEDATVGSLSSFEIPSNDSSSSVNVRNTLRTLLTPIAEASTEAVGAGADDERFRPCLYQFHLVVQPETCTGWFTRDGARGPARHKPRQ